MNSRILPSQVDEVEVGKFAADASELGWPPGHWPAHVDTTLGNGQRLKIPMYSLRRIPC